jgi:hypothetical protein
MHRAIEITVSPQHTARLVDELKGQQDVIELSVLKGASVKPEGDIVLVKVLNRGSDEVLRSVQRAQDERGATVSVATSELASLIDPARKDQIKSDVDEELWEEMETGLLHQSRVTSNYLILMATGGAIAAAGLVSDTAAHVTLSVAASIIAPAFEPLAKIPLGVVLRRRDTALRALTSLLAGYAALMLAAALMFFVLEWSGAVAVGDYVGSREVHRMLEPTLKTTLVSACAALAGITITAAYREIIIAGPVIALVLVPVAASVGVSLAARQPGMAVAALGRLGVDVVLILVISALYVLWKQKRVHRREPMV